MSRYIPIPLRPVADSGQFKVAESTDPYEGIAVTLSTPGHDGLAAMGRAFVEEFALIGWSRQRIARMFRVPHYAAAHAVYKAKGPDFVAQMIDDVLGPESEEA